MGPLFIVFAVGVLLGAAIGAAVATHVHRERRRHWVLELMRMRGPMWFPPVPPPGWRNGRPIRELN